MVMIELPSEQDRDHRQQRKKTRKDIRTRFVKPDGESRPPALWRRLSTLLRTLRLADRRVTEPLRYGRPPEGYRNGDVLAQTLLERGLTVAMASIWMLAGVFVLVDGLDGDSWLFDHTVLGIVVLALALACLALTITDLATYQPRLFALCANDATEFFRQLARFSESIEDQVSTIPRSPPRTVRHVKAFEQRLLEASTEFVFLDGIRLRIMARVLVRLGALLCSLALVGYALMVVTHGSLVDVRTPGGGTMMPGDVGFPQLIYFTAVTFSTTGFGDITPTHEVLGYSYIALILATSLAVVYFFLTEVVASHGEFRTNLRGAAAAYVQEHAEI